MIDVLLINPPYYKDIFSKSKVRSAIAPGATALGLASVAGGVIESGHTVKILDLNIEKDPDKCLVDVLKELNPRYAGITSTTPLIKKVYELTDIIKSINRDISVVAGGPHPSALPLEVLEESKIDCVVRGEGDFVLSSIIEKGFSTEIPNLYFKRDGRIFKSNEQNYVVNDIDKLPFPAYELFDIRKYVQPRISARKSPVGYLETSRGCYGKCIFCNKNIHGCQMRMKSPARVIGEIERLLRLGFREIHIIDDVFTADMKRAQTICEEIIHRKLKFSWYPRGGIRVDRVNAELLKVMKRAGCYRIPFGIESGSQRIIDIIGKHITLEQAEKAVKLAKEAGLETECYFMIGLPGETVDDINKTMEFSIKLNPDYAKFAVTIPLPGTSMFESMEKKGQIKTRDWSKFNFSASPKELYNHDTLSWEMIDNYYNMLHRKYYFRLGYVLKTIYRTLRNGTFLAHVKAFIHTRW